MAAAKTTEISAAELELKRRGRRRLIGAITLALLAIVFLPMIFDREPKQPGQGMKTQEIAVQVPAKDSQPALPPPSVAPVVVPAPVEAAKAAPSSTSAVPAVPVAEPVPTVTTTPPAKVAAKEPPTAPAKAEKTAKPSPAKAVETKATDKRGFVVQLGVFGSAENAKHAIDKMKDAKLPVYSEDIPIKTGNATRVRVGPFATREKADAILAQIKLAGGDGKIVPLN